MNRRIPSLILLAALPLAALAAESQQAPAPPPPEMDAPAVKAAPVEKTAAKEAASADQNAATDANGNTAPTVSVRKQGNDTVEEYRKDGRLTMIRITGNGVTRTYIANADGKLVRDAKQGPVDPVYFTVYQWK